MCALSPFLVLFLLSVLIKNRKKKKKEKAEKINTELCFVVLM